MLAVRLLRVLMVAMLVLLSLPDLFDDSLGRRFECGRIRRCHRRQGQDGTGGGLAIQG